MDTNTLIIPLNPQNPEFLKNMLDGLDTKKRHQFRLSALFVQQATTRKKPKLSNGDRVRISKLHFRKK